MIQLSELKHSGFVFTWKLNEELRLYTARSCEDELSLVEGEGRGRGGGGVRGVQDEDILSMHLESHIGLFSAPLYDFSGKAL